MKKMKVVYNDNCVFCNKMYGVEVFNTDFEKYLNGALAQDAFPDLNVDDREFIISSICPTCQSKIFD